MSANPRVFRLLSGRRLDHIRLTIGDLTDGNGKILAASNIDWQLVGLVGYGPTNDKTTDVLLPVATFGAASGNTHSLLATVLAPAGARAGKYTGTITIETDSGLDSIVNINATVHDFAIPAADTAGCMHFRTTWTLNDLGSPAADQPYGDLLLSYRMSPDNIYWNPMPDIENLEHWHTRGMTAFTAGRADNLWHPGDLQNPGGVDDFFAALRASPHEARCARWHNSSWLLLWSWAASATARNIIARVANGPYLLNCCDPDPHCLDQIL